MSLEDLSQSVLLTHRRIALLTDGYSTPFLAKTAINMLRYRTADIAVVLDRKAAGGTSQHLFGTGGNVPVVCDLAEVADIDALYIGIAPPGGKLPEEWKSVILEALKRKIDIVSGLHDFLTDNETYVRMAAESGSRLIDVRRNKHKETAQCVSFRQGNVR
ncbi:MAG: DUF1611 domain-containing protein, partial [Pirellula staleyi]